MKSLIFSICLLLSSVVLSQQTYKECLESVKELFKTTTGQEKAKEFLQLQGKLTLHRLAFALGMQNQNAERFRVEHEIRKILQSVNEREKSDEAFASAKKEFEENPLSRENLARVMPFISDILNTQLSNTNPTDRKKYHLQTSDMKLLAILAEKEYDHLLKDGNSDRAILNYVKIINSSMRGRKPAPINLKIFKNQMNKIQKDINDLIQELAIGSECRELFSQVISCEMNPTLESDFVDIINSISDIDKHEKLKYRSFWLHVSAQTSAPITSPRVPRTPPEIREIESQIDISNNQSKDESLTTEQELLSRMATKVLARYDYYLDRETLVADPELTFALAQAIDDNKDNFIYKNRSYQLPDIYNKKHDLPYVPFRLNFFGKGDFIKKDRDIREYGENYYEDNENELEQVINKLLASENELCGDPKDMSALRDLAYYMKGAKDIGQTVFDFHDGSFCYTETGIKVPQSLAGLTSINSTQSSSSLPRINISEHEVEVSQALSTEQATVIIGQRIYHLSGVEITPENNQSIEQTQAKIENHPYFLDGEVIRMTDNPSETLSSDKIGEIILNYQRGNLRNTNFTLPRTLDKKQLALWAMSIANNTPYYFYQGNKYSILSDQIVQREPASIALNNSSYLNDRQRRLREIEINRLSDRNKIVAYHQLYPSQCEFYTIIDKQSGSLTVYDSSGKIQFTPREVLTGKQRGDERIKNIGRTSPEDGQKLKTNNSTGAGIYYTIEERDENDHPYYRQFEGNLLALRYEDGSSVQKENDEDEESLTAIHQVPTHLLEQRYGFFDGDPTNNNQTGGCINMTFADYQTFIKTIKPNESEPWQECPVYVLPEEPGLSFHVSNGRLSFGPDNREEFCKPKENNLWSDNGCHEDYYFSNLDSPTTNSVKPIAIRYNDDIFAAIAGPDEDVMSEGNQKAAREKLDQFIRTIEDKKPEIMQRLGVSNNEYNDLARIAVAVMGIESDFCTSVKLKLKETRYPVTIATQAGVIQLKDENNKPIIGDQGQDLVSLRKWTKGDESANSRGCTQIKNAARVLKDVRLNERAENFDENTLMDPAISAELTMYYLGLALKELQREKRAGLLQVDLNTIDTSENGLSNTQDYLYYLYMGSKHRLRSGSATPDSQISSQIGEINRILDEVQLFQER